MIIWGIKGRQKVLDKGTFFCPNCNQTRPYELKRAGNYFSLFFIPLIRIQKLGEYVECQVCKNRFDPKVLGTASQGTLQLVASTRYALLHGTHPEAARQQLIAKGLDPHSADRVIEMAQRQ